MLWGHHGCGKVFKGMYKQCLESWKGQRRHYKQVTKYGMRENSVNKSVFSFEWFVFISYGFLFHGFFSIFGFFLKGFKWTSWPTCRWRRKPLIESGMPQPPLWQLPLTPGLGTALSSSSWHKVDYTQQSSLLLLGPFSAVPRTRSPRELLL